MVFAYYEHKSNGRFCVSRQFSDMKTLEGTANALGSIMFEGFNPMLKGIEIIRDYVIGKISLPELMAFAKQKYPPKSRD